MDCSLPGSSVHGIFQARVLEWGAIAIALIPYFIHSFIHSVTHSTDFIGTTMHQDLLQVLRTQWWITIKTKSHVMFSSVQSLRLFSTPWTTARQASLSITNSRSSLRLTSIESVIPSRHLTLCRPLSSCPQSLPAAVFSNESTLCMSFTTKHGLTFEN